MKYIFLFFVIIFLSNNIFAQIEGISDSKVNSKSVDVVGYKKLEVEPNISFSASSKSWNNSGQLTNIYNSTDSIIHATEMSFRVTYGLLDKLELGGSFSTELTGGNLGLKYIILQNNTIGIAAISGAYIPLGNKIVDKATRTAQNTISAGLGVVVSSNINENLSVDFDAQGQSFIGNTMENHNGSLFFNADIGYYIFEKQLQLVTGFGYRHARFENFNNNLFTIHPGITLETGKNYVFVLSFPFDVAGKNADKTVGFSFSLTLAID